MSSETPVPNRSLSLEDIAAKAGVSRSTVSRVINHDPHVSEQTRSRVMAVIKKEGYAPNPAARALVTQRTRVIGVVIPLEPMVLFEDAYYFPTLLQGISKTAQQRDYAMLLWLSQSDEDMERFRQRIVTNRLMDGVVIASATCNDPLIDQFLQMNTPFVMVERPARHLDRISYVSIDNVNAAFNAVFHLISLGRHRIGTITGNLAISDGLDRVEGYKKALKSAGFPVDEHLIVEGNFSHRTGYMGMKQLLKHKVDAVFAANDITARGALQALHDAQLRVPEDVALIGFDNLPTAVQVNPLLTTIHQPIEEKGALAASILIDLIENDDTTPPRQVLLPTKLMVRASCGTINL